MLFDLASSLDLTDPLSRIPRQSRKLPPTVFAPLVEMMAKQFGPVVSGRHRAELLRLALVVKHGRQLEAAKRS